MSVDVEIGTSDREPFCGEKILIFKSHQCHPKKQQCCRRPKSRRLLRHPKTRSGIVPSPGCRAVVRVLPHYPQRWPLLVEVQIQIQVLEFRVTGGFERYTGSRATAVITFLACEIRRFSS